MTNPRQPLPQKVEQMLLRAGIRPGEKIPLETVNKVFDAQNLDTNSRLIAKAELARLCVIEL